MATKNRKVDDKKNAPSSRKRSYKQSISDGMGKNAAEGRNGGGTEDKKKNESTTRSNAPSDRNSKRKKRRKNGKRARSLDPEKPLSGMVLSVSTLKDNTKAKTSSSGPDHDDSNNDAPSTSYNEVCRSCRDLGADVIDLVCKRVNVLVCTRAAVRQATQRVRKAIKKNKPLVSVDWLEQCRSQKRRLDFEEYRLDKEAKDGIQSREDRLQTTENDTGDSTEFEAIPDSGWTEAEDLGCCCVCHENGTTADCPWCVDCNYKP
eukprot:CAMPEP_0201150324 /NCGR_PEP_ID=MMETSP0851-20130426/11504_1 /ASSEMBLY_ACC=CAM_ASM_000631 /TAXON_ID=183588 /ORGANISM="Pseudo-nitzschia fraudulenta, Strain WWA7" /LENGTH=260 /DNA_ID=CAMNT_0047426973 /DNA_START=12 /DNA_END=794 /DNA_ORIENTATION=-